MKKVGEEFKKYNYFGQSKEGLKTAGKVVLIEFAAVLLLFALALLLQVQLFILIPLLLAVIFTGFGVIIYGALIRKKLKSELMNIPSGGHLKDSYYILAI